MDYVKELFVSVQEKREKRKEKEKNEEKKKKEKEEETRRNKYSEKTYEFVLTVLGTLLLLKNSVNIFSNDRGFKSMYFEYVLELFLVMVLYKYLLSLVVFIGCYCQKFYNKSSLKVSEPCKE